MRKTDDPSLILRVEPRGIVPATPLDMEMLDEMRRGTELEARTFRVPPSPNLRRWWAMMSLLARVDGRWENKRAASNAMLLAMNCVDSVALYNGGFHHEPMSLASFTDGQLAKLCEKAVFLIEQEILPGHSMEELRRDYQRHRIGRSPD